MKGTNWPSHAGWINSFKLLFVNKTKQCITCYFKAGGWLRVPFLPFLTLHLRVLVRMHLATNIRRCKEQWYKQWGHLLFFIAQNPELWKPHYGCSVTCDHVSTLPCVLDRVSLHSPQVATEWSRSHVGDEMQRQQSDFYQLFPFFKLNEISKKFGLTMSCA